MRIRTVLLAGGILMSATAIAHLGARECSAQESSVQQQLRLLYQQNGGRMPEMDINRIPPRQQQRRTTVQGYDLSRRNGSVVGVHRKQGFFERLFSRSGNSKSTQTGTRYRTNYSTAKDVQQPQLHQQQYTNTAPPQYSQQVRQPNTQLYSQRNQAASQYFPAGRQAPPPPPPPAVKGDDLPVLFDETTNQLVKEKPMPLPATPSVPVKSVATPKSVQQEVSQPKARPKAPQLPPAVRIEKPNFSNGGQDIQQDNPFAGTTTKPSVKKPSKDQAFPPVKKNARRNSPPPVLKIESAQQIDRRTRGFQPTRASYRKTRALNRPQSNEEKMRMIIARRGLSGFRGFCPVHLRDERGLSDCDLQYAARYEGKTYHFSSEAAKAAFIRTPKKYAPAKMGLDIVRLVEGGETIEGSLEHAAWYRDRIYLFSSATTLKLFVGNPKKYAVR